MKHLAYGLDGQEPSTAWRPAPYVGSGHMPLHSEMPALAMADILRFAATQIGRSGISADIRGAVRRLLAMPAALPAVIDEVENAPREEVVQEGAEIIAQCLDEHGVVGTVRALPLRGFFGRIAFARALGYAHAGDTRGERGALLLDLLTTAAEVGVRDAAASALAYLGDASTADRLQAALASESDPLVRESIAQAIQDLR